MEITVELKTQFDQLSASLADVTAATSQARAEAAAHSKTLAALTDQIEAAAKASEKKSKQDKEGSTSGRKSKETDEERAEALKKLADAAALTSTRLEAQGRSQEVLAKIGSQYAAILRETGQANSDLEKAWRAGLSPAENSARKLVELAAASDDARLKTEAFQIATGELSARMADQIRRQDTNVGSQNKLSRSLSELLDELRVGLNPELAKLKKQEQALVEQQEKLAKETDDATKQTVEYTAAQKQLEAQLADVRGEMAGFGKISSGVKETVGDLKKELGELPGPLGTLQSNLVKTGAISEAGAVSIGLLVTGTTAMTAAAVAGGAALTAMALKAYEAIDGIADLSARVGVSAEELSQFRYASSQTDVSLESLGDGVKKLGIFMSEAQVKTSDQAQLFKMLGVETTDANDKMRSTADVMVDLAGVFGSLGTEQEKLTLATRLFGKAGAELLPIFADGQAGLQGMIDKNRELGLELSGPSLKAAGDYEKASKDLSATINGLTEAIGVRFLPTLTKVVELATEAASAVRNRLMPALNNEPVKDLNSELEKLGQTMQGAFGKGAIVHVETLTEKEARLAAERKATAEAEKQAEADRKKAQDEQIKRIEKMQGLYERQGVELGSLDAAYTELARAILAADTADDGLFRGGIQGAQDYTAQIQGTTAALDQMGYAARASGELILSTTLTGISQLNSIAGQALSTWQAESESSAQAAAASIAKIEQQLAKTTDATERRRLQSKLASLKAQEAANEQAAVRAYRLQQASGLIGVGISTSEAIMQAMTLPPPASYIAAGFAAALGSAQAAMIASQPAPSYSGAGGSMPGSVSGPDMTASMTRASQATSQSVSAGQAAAVESAPMNANVARSQNSSVVVTDAEYTASAGRRTLELAPGDEASVRRSGRMGRASDESVPLLERIARTMDNLVEELRLSRQTASNYSMARKA